MPEFELIVEPESVGLSDDSKDVVDDEDEDEDDERENDEDENARIEEFKQLVLEGKTGTFAGLYACPAFIFARVILSLFIYTNV